jgi:hypothetical protein
MMEFVVRYKIWRSRKDTHLHLRCAEGSEAFESLPVAVRNLGPWTGGSEGELDRLRLPYRILLNEQKFVVIHAHISQLQLEAARARKLHPANTDCPECKGKGEVPQHGLAETEDLSPMQWPWLGQGEGLGQLAPRARELQPQRRRQATLSISCPAASSSRGIR